jgi:hypothetical protein
MIANVQESNNSLKFAIDVNNCMLDSMWKKTYNNTIYKYV